MEDVVLHDINDNPHQNVMPSQPSLLQSALSSTHTHSTTTSDDNPRHQYQRNHHPLHHHNNDDISKPSIQFYNLLNYESRATTTLSSSEQQESSHLINHNSNGPIGQVSIEILQCLGLPLGNDPKASLTGAASATPTSNHASSSGGGGNHSKQALPFALIVCGKYAFQTDGGTISSNPMSGSSSSNSGTANTSGGFKNQNNNMNPIWTCDMRRACIIPIDHAYARIYIGIFRRRRQRRSPAPPHLRRTRPDSSGNRTVHKSPSNHATTTTTTTTALTSQEKSHKNRDIFIGRVVIDVARLRPNSYYDVTLPLRQSAQVYVRQSTTSTVTNNTNEHNQPAATGGCGAVRFRMHLQYDSERSALLSYLVPTRRSIPLPSNDNNNAVTVHCCDVKSFQNVSRVVHGIDMPNHFSLRQLQATIREINLTRIHVLRYLRKQECDNLYHWRYPTISAFVFVAYMHSIYTGSMKYIPGHVLTYLLLHLYKNYAYYGPLNTSMYNEFIPPTWEEMFLTLLRNGKQMAPIEMERKIENQYRDHHLQPPVHPPNVTVDMDHIMVMSQHTATSSSSTSVSTGKIPLKAIAQAFEDGVNTQSLRHHFRVYHNVFRGNDAVTFLIHHGYATSREQAVTIGRRLSEQMHLFEHVTQEHRFEDKALFYVFTHHDRYEYVVKTHQPLGKNLFRMLGFLPSSTIAKTKAQLDMPYTDGVDHPRMKVKDSVCLPFKSARKALVDGLIEHEHVAESDESDSMSEGFEHGMSSFLDQNSLLDDTNEDETDNDSDSNCVQYLKKPPNQNMTVKNKNEKSIPVLLNEARNKVHGVLLHLFDDRVYKLPKKVPVMPKRKVSPSRRNLIHAIKSQRHLDSSHQRDDNSNEAVPHKHEQEQQQHEQCEAAIKNEYDKLLGIGKYSHPNVVIARLGLFVQPIIEIAIGWLSLFRALFNIFTWQDPILSFWISFLGPIVIVILHVFPWRLILGIIGLVVFGPQNWILRILRERKYGPDLYDPDRIVHRKKLQTDEDDHHQHVPLFSSYLADSGRALYSEESEMELFSSGTIRQVIVPYSPLMYSHRFYDWPPESEHTRLSTSCVKPANAHDGTMTAETNRDNFNFHGADDIRLQDESVSSPVFRSFDSPMTKLHQKSELHLDDHDDSDGVMIHTKSNHLINRRRRRPFHKDNRTDSNSNNDEDTHPVPPSPRWGGKVSSSLQHLQEKLRHRNNNNKGTLQYSSSMED